MLVILSGVAGAGKDTIKKEIIKRMENVKSIPSFTSRPPREGDIPGQTYIFLSKEEFEEKIKGFKFVKYHESRSCIEYKLIDSEIEKYFTGFTTRSTEKEIPQWIIDLSKDKLIHFYNGYYSGDGGAGI